jgi:CubicO group peptidase (beta-lactamase class C family)
VRAPSPPLPGDDAGASGLVAPGFEPVRTAFVENLGLHGDVGASCAVYLDGELCVDLWGGTADTVTGRPWTQDTLGLVYSVTKGAVAVLCNLLAQQGRLNLDAPVAEYWPEFAGGGKADVTVRMLLTHRAGLPVLDKPLTLGEVLRDGVAAEALAGQRPLWAPGSDFGYHALTFGWLLDEVVRRATGRSIAELMTSEVTEPLGIDLFIGLPASQEHRVADLVDAAMPPALPAIPDITVVESIADPDLREAILQAMRATGAPLLLLRAMTVNGVLRTPHAATWNASSIRRATMPAANGITNARSIARLYAACIGEVAGVRLLSDQTLDEATAEQSAGVDRVTGLYSRFGTGFMLPTEGTAMLSAASFGHEGVGGALGFADRMTGVSLGYVPNRLSQGLATEARVQNLLSAVRSCVGSR